MQRGWCLAFTAGIHAGARVRLAAGQYRIGNAAGNDIVIADDGVAAEQLVLRLSVDAARAMANAPLEVRLPTGLRRQRRWKAGEVGDLVRGSVLRMGTSELCLLGPAPILGRKRLVGVAISGLAMLFALGASASYRLSAPAASTAMADASRVLAGPAEVNAEIAAAELRARLSAEQLDHTIMVSTARGLITARGRLTPADMERWWRTREWFDAAFGGRVVMTADLAGTADDSNPTLDIAAVAMSPAPYVITRNGERYMEGATLDGGWSIERIGKDAVILRNGSRLLRMTL